MLHLVTAHKDEPHITAENQGALNIEIFGNDDFVFDVGRSLEASAISNNLVRIYDGRGMMEGRFFELDEGDYEDVTIENGTQGQKRIDLIVARYSKDNQSLIETISFEVIKGTPSATPVQPSYNDGSILEGDTLVDFPLYAIHLDGISIENIEQLFEVKDGIGDALGEISPSQIDEWWGSTLESGDDLEY
jgi:hypothetical protein